MQEKARNRFKFHFSGKKKTMTRREYIQNVLQEVFLALPDDATEKEVRQAVSAAFPFGIRSHHPYKIWLDESRKWLDRRFPENKKARDRKKLQEELAKRGIPPLQGVMWDE
jgi:hypothetical protein